MRILRLSYGVKGFVRLNAYAVRFAHMIATTAKDRVKILAFWEKHGLAATREAFGAKRSTLYAWKQRLQEGGGMLEVLNPGSTRPGVSRPGVSRPGLDSPGASIALRTYPKCPKMNPHDERFNRTLQEEFVDYHAGSLLDVHAFNRKLVDHLLWHNGERPHHALGLKTPVQFLVDNSPHLSRMWWTDTSG